MNKKNQYDSSKKDRQYLSKQNPIRINEPGHIHFVTTSCMDRQPFFAESRSCKILMDSLNVARERKGFLILGYVIMPEHVHLLVAPNQCGCISNAMQWIKWYASKYGNPLAE